MPPEVEIGSRSIGDGHPCFVIAEAGVNHNGDPALAEQLVHAAKDAGVDAVKFQTFEAEALVTADTPKAAYQVANTGGDGGQLEMLRALELEPSAFRRIADLCRELDIEFLSTPYGPDDVDLLDEIGVAAFKVASGMIVEPTFLRHIAQKGKPVLLSTGMATHGEIAEAVEAVREAGNEQIVLLRCTTNYPASPASANLASIRTMRNAFGCVAGYSDHTPGHLAAVLSLPFGASVVEKHFTLDRGMEGPDHSSSCDPGELAELVRWIRSAEESIGDGVIRPVPEELENREAMRRSVVAAKDIATGQILGEDGVTLKRPATGISPSHFEAAVRCRAKVDIAAGTVLQWGMLEHGFESRSGSTELKWQV